MVHAQEAPLTLSKGMAGFGKQSAYTSSTARRGFTEAAGGRPVGPGRRRAGPGPQGPISPSLGTVSSVRTEGKACATSYRSLTGAVST